MKEQAQNRRDGWRDRRTTKVVHPMRSVVGFDAVPGAIRRTYRVRLECGHAIVREFSPAPPKRSHCVECAYATHRKGTQRANTRYVVTVDQQQGGIAPRNP